MPESERKSPIDLTPSWIATRLLTSNAEVADRAIVEAMAERAIQIVHENGTPVATFFAIERAMASAARQVVAQHDIRCARALKWIESCNDEPVDVEDPDDALAAALESDR